MKKMFLIVFTDIVSRFVVICIQIQNAYEHMHVHMTHTWIVYRYAPFLLSLSPYQNKLFSFVSQAGWS